MAGFGMSAYDLVDAPASGGLRHAVRNDRTDDVGVEFLEGVVPDRVVKLLPRVGLRAPFPSREPRDRLQRKTG